MTGTSSTIAASARRPGIGRPATGRQHAAFTLLELLVVLGLILAIGAISLPTVLDGVERRRFDSAVDDAIGTLRLARAHARLESITVEVVVVEGPEAELTLLARSIDLASFAEDDSESGDSARAIGEPWAERVLAVLLVSAADSPPGVEDDGDAEPESEATRSSSDARASSPDPLAMAGSGRGESPRRETRIAIFAADGSAPVVAPLRLRDEHGRRATVRVNPWTGLASLDRGAAGTPTFEPITDSLDEPSATPQGAETSGASPPQADGAAVE